MYLNIFQLMIVRFERRNNQLILNKTRSYIQTELGNQIVVKKPKLQPNSYSGRTVKRKK